MQFAIANYFTTLHVQLMKRFLDMLMQFCKLVDIGMVNIPRNYVILLTKAYKTV